MSKPRYSIVSQTHGNRKDWETLDLHAMLPWSSRKAEGICHSWAPTPTILPGCSKSMALLTEHTSFLLPFWSFFQALI